ncbi:MAG: NADH-quinone oxidoreductase subunit M [Streptosporangiales bacterium]|nr:NADH-quinone oxidoreductase subunit M [Streptosporangiales bacterium]
MTSFPWLTVIGGVPLVGAIIVAAMPKASTEAAKRFALAVSCIVVVLTAVMAAQFRIDGPRFQFVEDYAWIPQFGVRYSLGLDGIGLVLVGLTVLLVPIALLGAWREKGAVSGEDGPGIKGYFALALVLETAVIGVFAATDLFVFYVLFEVMLVPMYFMIGRYGGPRRQYAAVKFFLYSLLGGMLMLAAVIGLAVIARQQGQTTFGFEALTQVDLSDSAARWLFLGFFIAFAIKAPMWPFHTWLPDAASEGRPTSALLLVGLMDKAGTFGMIRYCLELFPQAAHFFTPVIVGLAVISVLYGALAAIGQKDLLRLIAYTSVSHFGFIVLGIFAMTSQGQVGATFYMVSHGFSTGALFLLAGVLIARHGSRQIDDYGGVVKVAPVLAGTFLIACLSGLALPGMSTFISEFLVLLGTFGRYPVAAIVATLGIILAAFYMLWLYQRTMTGTPGAGVEKIRDLGRREKLAVAPLIALLLFLGLFPKPVLDVIDPAVQHTMTRLDVQDVSAEVQP